MTRFRSDYPSREEIERMMIEAREARARYFVAIPSLALSVCRPVLREAFVALPRLAAAIWVRLALRGTPSRRLAS